MSDRQSDLQSQCRRLRALATALILAFVGVLAIDMAFASRAADLTEYIMVTVPNRLPVLFYLMGIWIIRNAFARLGAGELFGQVLPLLLRRLGWALVGGGFVSVFLTQWLLRLLDSHVPGPLATFDPSAITIGLVGLLLIVLSDLMTRAEIMRQELEEFL